MPSKFNPRTSLITESPTRAIDKIRIELARKGEDIILLSAGQPSIPPPLKIRQELAKLLLEENMNLFSYTPTRGLPSVLEAVRLELTEEGVNINKDQITLTAGGQNALFATLSALLEPGDSIVVTDPLYFGYWPHIDYLGLRPIRIPTSLENGYQPSLEAIERALSAGARAIILITPDNPTGRILSETTLKTIAKLARDYNAWLIIDEAYRTLIYEGKHYYAYNYAPENTIALDTFSKDPGMPGWRLGFAYGPSEAVKKISLLVQETVYCPPLVAQKLAEIYLRNREERIKHISYVREIYKKRRDSLVKALREYLPEARFHLPEGGMFLFVDLDNILPENMSGESLAMKLLEEARVATIPGGFFSSRYKRALRLSFVSEPSERLEEAVKRISIIINNLFI